MPDAPQDFFIASAGASAALIGLLFVAVSIQTERVFGSQESGNRLAFAGSAFFTLSNILSSHLVACYRA